MTIALYHAAFYTIGLGGQRAAAGSTIALRSDHLTNHPCRRPWHSLAACGWPRPWTPSCRGRRHVSVTVGAASYRRQD